MYLRLNITLTLVNVTSYFACCQKLFSRKSNHTCICEDNKGLNIIELINWPNLLSHLLAKFSFSKKSNCFKVIQTNTVKHVLFILQKKKPTFAQIFLWKKKERKTPMTLQILFETLSFKSACFSSRHTKLCLIKIFRIHL